MTNEKFIGEVQTLENFFTVYCKGKYHIQCHQFETLEYKGVKYDIELNLCKDDNEGMLLMEEVKKNNNKMSNSINMINDDSNVENRRSAMEEERGNLSLSDYELENDVNGDDDDDLFQMDE